MSCGCTSTATPSPSITCGSCGYQCTSCVCPPDPIVMPTVTCADPATCTEIYPLECVQYTGEDIKCSSEASTLYPNITHIVATNGDMLPNILNNINNQLCYLFSSDFISQMLTNIQNDPELSGVLCNLVTECTTPTALICPTVSSVTYNYDNTTLQYYLSAQINYVPNATTYTYKFYTESTYNSGTFDSIIGSGSISQPLTALPITLSSIISSPTTNTSSKNYAVLVYATGSLTASGINPASYPSFTYNTLAVANPNNCGINKYTGSTAEITCSLNALTGSFKASPSNTKALQFIFTQESSNASYIPVTYYYINCYLKTTIPTVSYVWQSTATIPYVSGQLENVDLYKLPTSATFTKTGTLVTITSTAHGLVSGMNIKIDLAVGTDIPANSYTITYLTANTFTISTPGSSTVSSPTAVTYKSQINPATDNVVVSIYTTTANPECWKGLPKQNTPFNDATLTSYLSNPQNNVYKSFQ